MPPFVWHAGGGVNAWVASCPSTISAHQTHTPSTIQKEIEKVQKGHWHRYGGRQNRHTTIIEQQLAHSMA